MLRSDLSFHKEQISNNFDGEEDRSRVYGGHVLFCARLQVTRGAMQAIGCSPGYEETRFDMNYSIEAGNSVLQREMQKTKIDLKTL